MTNSTIFALLIITILCVLCYLLWKKGKYRDPGQENTYYNELKNCPFDGKHCGIIGKSVKKSYVTKVCLKCPRYDNWLKKGLDEQELREKVKEVMK